jgi:hypothetical protein
VQAERADNPGRLRVLLQHERVHAVQPQLTGQHQAGRSAADHDHVNHEDPERFSVTVKTDRKIAAAIAAIG